MRHNIASVLPYIFPNAHLILAALFPIYTGSHASLSCPSSAAKPAKRSSDGNKLKTNDTRRMEGLSPTDALIFPVLAGCMLAGLYLLITRFEIVEVLNKVINWYMSIFGIVSIARLFADSSSTIHSFIFPQRYTQQGLRWEVDPQLSIVYPEEDKSAAGIRKSSPLPGFFSQIAFSSRVSRILWRLRDLPTKPLCVLRVTFRGVMDARIPIDLQAVISLAFAVLVVLYFNVVDKPWWLMNVLGFSFSYSALQLMSPSTFWTGTLVLTSLFFYDIYMVFFTPLMITVATKLDIPAKLLFPRPPGPGEDPNKKAFSMLGLGDVVLPGLMIGLALRFDLYLFYLQRQTRRGVAENSQSVQREDLKESEDKPASASELVKEKYDPATGGWGERFWLGSRHRNYHDGGFPKTYFHASLVGYVIGLICTLFIMNIFKHGQPALLYLVPGVLGSVWGTAFFRGDIRAMWNYSEFEDPELSNANTIGKEINDIKPDVKDVDDADLIEKRCLMSISLHLPEPATDAITAEKPNVIEGTSNPHSAEKHAHQPTISRPIFGKILDCVRYVSSFITIGPPESPRPLVISNPYDVQHNVHVTLDNYNKYQGLPPEWDEKISELPKSTTYDVPMKRRKVQ